jgi:metallo-beta-lactamase family protein
MVRTANESKGINLVKQPSIIMASSGMCTGGRIKHHLRHNLERPESTILFVGYQGEGTLGRQILEGAKSVRIHGRQIDVRARIAQIYGFSGHADRSALLRWLTNFKPAPRQTFFTHGEERVALAFCEHVTKDIGWPAIVPHYQDVVELT